MSNSKKKPNNRKSVNKLAEVSNLLPPTSSRPFKKDLKELNFHKKR